MFNNENAAEVAANIGPRRRRLPAHVVVPLAVIGAVGGLLVASAGSVLQPAKPVRVMPVVFAEQDQKEDREPEADAPARRAHSGRTVQAPGWLEADPFSVACTALADGIVEEVLVLEGERVEKGQVVARLVSEDAELALANAEARLAAAEAELAVAQADLEAARMDWEYPIERERAVAVTEAQLAETEAELAQLPSLIAAERATLERLREELARTDEARERGAASAIEYVILQKDVAAQVASLEALEKRRGILEARRDRLEAEARAARRNAELRIPERRALDAAEAAVARARAARDQARARRDEARLRLDRMVIRAPISGFVQERLKVPGDKVMLGMDARHSAHVLHVYDPERIQVRVDVPLADAAHVFIGQECNVIVDVLPDREFAGEVTRITHEADLQKNTLEVKVRVIDPVPLLKPEMLTRVEFLPPDGGAPARDDASASPSGGAVLVPAESILAGPGGSGAVWVVRERRSGKGIVRRVPVSITGQEADGWVRVEGALRPGDLLAVGETSLSPGERVRMLAADQGGAS